MRIATVARIPLHLHWTFLAAVGAYALYSLVDSGLGAVVEAMALGGALFGSVVLHELGHALAARLYGIRTRHITLYPFGGIAAIERMPEDPGQELVIAVAGPAVNFAIVAVITPLALISGSWGLAALAALNLLMGVFNLIPAFPMDGGRVLRAALSVPLGHTRASLISMALGRMFALLFVIGGFLAWVPGLVLVGGFLFVAIAMERRRLEWTLHQRRMWQAA